MPQLAFVIAYIAGPASDLPPGHLVVHDALCTLVEVFNAKSSLASFYEGASIAARIFEEDQNLAVEYSVHKGPNCFRRLLLLIPPGELPQPMRQVLIQLTGVLSRHFKCRLQRVFNR